jgi:hypothetical protein
MSDTPQDDSRREGRHIVQYHIDRDPKSEQTDSRDDGHERRQPAPQAPQADGGDDPAGHGPPEEHRQGRVPGAEQPVFRPWSFRRLQPHLRTDPSHSGAAAGWSGTAE